MNINIAPHEADILALYKQTAAEHADGKGYDEAIVAFAYALLSKLRAPVAGEAQRPVAWENFPAYLIDHCEGDTISEEGLQRALGKMLADPKYAAPQASEAALDADRQPASAPLLKAARRAVLALAAAAERDPAFQGDYDALSAALSGQPGAQKDCNCATCRPHSVEMRIILCGVCGDKRCPHAADHRNECVGTGAQNGGSDA